MSELSSSAAPPPSSQAQMPPASHSGLPPLSQQSVDYEAMPMPPASIRSCGSQAYVASYIPTSNPFPPRSVQDLMTSMKSFASATDYVRSYNEVPSVEEALAALDHAAAALQMRRYRDALKLYLEGGYAMANVAERQTHAKICNLLTSKGFEMLNWCGKLCDWIEGRITEKNPRPGVHKVGIPCDTWDEDWVGPFLDEDEARRVWYTPVYCPNPSDFTNVGYRLRCVEMQRRPRVMICITIYNEGPEQLKATLRKLANNFAYLKNLHAEDRKGLSTEFCGDDAWQNVLLCIVADGRQNLNEKMLDYLTSVGLYDEDLLTINSAGIGAQCHLFEHTLQLKGKGKSLLPMQTIFALKEQKASKLDSHNWFFSAFAEQVQPKYTIVMDVGTMLTKAGLYHMLRAFETNPQIGGACGQLAVDEPYRNLSNWVVSAQHFEYKISNILDKSLESCFGYISVLPGAFSGYRYEAIRGAPLEAYFQTLNVDLDVLGPFISNMYLAEDRILCFELLAKRNCAWTMHYVKDAVARTDVPHDLVGLISQRRRWLNGSFFATLFSIWNWGRVYSQSSHSFFRKFALLFYYFYMLFNIVFSWLLPANVFLALYFIVFQAFQKNRLHFVDTTNVSQGVLDFGVYFFNIVYIFGLIMLVIIGLGNNPKHMRLTYYLVSSIFGIIMIFATVVSFGIYFAMDLSVKNIVYGVLVFGVYFLGPLLHGEVHHVLLTFIQYTALIPSFVNIFTIYSFCNLQNLSWGTKGLVEEPALAPGEDNEKGDFKDVLAKRKALEERQRELTLRQDQKQHNFEAFRTNILLLWVFSNLIYTLSIVHFSSADAFLPVIFVAAAAMNSIRFLGSFGHFVYRHSGWVRRLLNTERSGNPQAGIAVDNSYRTLDDHYATLLEEQNTEQPGRSYQTNELPGRSFQPSQLSGRSFQPSQLPGRSFQPPPPKSMPVRSTPASKA